jgi:geranylgeranyl diphosphate synthase, type II
MTNASFPSLAQYTEELRPRIDAALRKHCRLPEGCSHRLRDAIRYALLTPGKRLRPMLAIFASDACGGTRKRAMPAACAVEMVHAYSLVHDDLPAMDNDDIRRGLPTCHKVYGEALAILAGDALLTMAFEVLAREVKPAELAAFCCAALAEAAGPCQLVGGQADDMSEKIVKKALSRESVKQLEAIHRRKTGALIRVSLRLGALTANADKEQLAALDDYGWRLGMAFQITDDLLDVCKSEESAGKRVGKDAANGKLTFPGLLGAKQSAARAKQLIKEACEATGPLGNAAHGLETLARYVLERSR